MKKESKDSLEVVRKQNECTSMLPIQDPEYIILNSIWLFYYTIVVYNICVHEADVINPLSSAFCAFILHDTKQKRGWESTDIVELEYRNERKHLHSKCTDERLVKGVLMV